MTVTYFDYRPAYLKHKREIDSAIARVLDSGRLILGPEGEGLEQEFAAYTGTVAAVGVNSGTDAISLALKALDVGAGDEVITVSNAGAPPVAAIRAAGATPRFVDVLPDSLVMNPAALDSALSSRTRCLLPVHLYGHPAPMERILEFAERHGLYVVEDCAQAHGASAAGRHVGGFGDVGCFSFYPTKNLGAFGDGGMCVTNNAEIAERLRRLRQYGFDDDRHAHSEGVNSRLDELQAAILRVRLSYLEESLRERRRIAREYLRGLEGSSFRIPATVAEGEHAYHLFVVQAPDRDRVVQRLEDRRIGFGIHYPDPAHLMEAYGFLGYGPGALPVTERAAREVVSLPIYEGLDPGAVGEVLSALLPPS